MEAERRFKVAPASRSKDRALEALVGVINREEVVNLLSNYQNHQIGDDDEIEHFRFTLGSVNK